MYAAGEMTEFLPQIVGPVGRIHFAGVRFFLRWMNGTLESGTHVGREISGIP